MPGGRGRLGLLGQLQRLAQWRGTTEHEALVVGVFEGHRIVDEQAVEQVELAQVVLLAPLMASGWVA